MERITGPDRIISIKDPKGFQIGLKTAGDLLTSGGIVAYPTESFYGLGVNAMDEKAIRNLFRIKQRDEDHPVLILIPSLDTLNRFVLEIPDPAIKIIDQFWPGGITLIFRAGPDISSLITAGTGKIGVRLSSHPFATGLAQAINNPITGTSANISGQPSCNNASEVINQMGTQLDLVLDGGETRGGAGSTILDMTENPPKILREGMITREQLGEFL